MHLPRAVRTSLAIAASILISSVCCAPVYSRPQSACPLNSGTRFICGVNNAEDMVKVPGKPWIIASSTAGPGEKGDRLHFITMPGGVVIPVDPANAPVRMEPQYASCPGKLTPGNFSGHGLFIADKQRRLYAVNHAREGVEIFDILEGIDTDVPTLLWVGCIPAPPNAQLNAVVALPDGGIAVTKFYDSRDPPNRWSSDLMTGEPSGYVIEWHRNTGWRAVPDSAVSGPNGLAISPDGRTYFIAAWGDRRIVRLSRGAEPTRRDSLDVGINIDNLRWAKDGQLVTAGQNLSGREQSTINCLASHAVTCPIPYSVIKIDAIKLKIESVTPLSSDQDFAAGSVAIDAGSEWWIGTFRGDRIARIRRK
jgi:sugar lactone lactonase YvrE